MRNVKRTDDEIDQVLNKADGAEDEGTSQWPGMSYEQGVAAAIRRLVGELPDNPMEE